MDCYRPPQHVRFCKSRDGTRIAYASCGSGPPLVWVGHFARHLELDWENPVWRAWLGLLARRHTLIRYDLRGCGLSDREVGDFSTERLHEDFAAVVSAAGTERFAFFGTAGNVAAGVRYAAEHPERVAHVVLYACHTRGRLVRPRERADDEEAETRLKAMELGWAKRNAAFGDFFTALHAPDTAREQFAALSELLRATTTPANASALIRSYWTLDLREVLPRVRCPALVLHARHDPIVPFEEGRLAAGLLADAKLVTLESRNHILQESEPAWRPFTQALEEFLPAVPAAASAVFEALTAREREVLEAVAQGFANDDIAQRLRMSPKTVRNHVSAILGKLRAESRAHAVALARDAGLGRPRI
jgi:pimeloyl-ACP methyl ester carboxylesterase/DNA-binding CsgD family transcriptional regulator